MSGAASLGAAARQARAARFAAEAAAGAPPPPERRFAHADFERAKIVRTDPEEKLLGLCRRKLLGGDALSDVQLAALGRLGVSVDELREEAAAAGRAAVVAAARPAVYAEALKAKGGAKAVAAAAAGKRQRSDSLMLLAAAPARAARAAPAAVPPAGGDDTAKRLARLQKRLRRIEEKQSTETEFNESWQRRLAAKPAIVQEIAELEAQLGGAR